MAVLAEHGIPKERIAIVDMGVDFRSVSRVGQQPKLHDGCFIGRLHPQKGLMDLLDIWALVSKKMRADLTIVGDGSLRSQRHLNTEIGKRGLHHCVHQVGPKFGDEYFRILKASRILLFPSLFEGRPITPLDSMACGTPVVSYSLPSFRSSPEYGGIITVPLGDRKEFAEVVRNLLTDRALYEKACETARKSVGQYDWGTVAGRVLDLVDRVLS